MGRWDFGDPLVSQLVTVLMAQEALRQIATLRRQSSSFSLNYTRWGGEKLTGLVLQYVYLLLCAHGVPRYKFSGLRAVIKLFSPIKLFWESVLDSSLWWLL